MGSAQLIHPLAIGEKLVFHKNCEMYCYDFLTDLHIDARVEVIIWKQKFQLDFCKNSGCQISGSWGFVHPNFFLPIPTWYKFRDPCLPMKMGC